MNALLNWLDDRTGYRGILHDALYENIPGGSRWRYVWGSTLVFTFAVQLITGTVLWMCYSPSAQTAWESVYYIQNDMQAGWLLRGIHHYTAQAMIVLLVLHLLQVVIGGAYKAPREINFWIGIILMKIVLGLSLTGYLLPWDQKGYWATQVATKIAGTVPVAGQQIQKVVVGGTEYGHHTLTRFFALHAGVLPGLLIAFLVIHIYVFRRHGITTPDPGDRPDAAFWPDQVLKDGVACLAVLATVLCLVFFLGADLGAPADPANAYSAARPEWYFLFLFQFLKFFPGEMEVIGAIVIPGAVMGLLFLMPIMGNWKIGHGFNVALLFGLIAGAGVLTFLAINEDRADLTYRNAVWEAHQFSKLSAERAAQGIPASGAARMMRDDPKAQAMTVITRQCLSCHAYTNAAGHGFAPEKPSAPNLHGFASREWIAGLLDNEKIVGPHYFGNTEFKEGEMVSFVRDSLADLGEGAADKVALALAAEAWPDKPVDDKDKPLLEAGRAILQDESAGCAQCHRFYDVGSLGTAPVLTHYGDRQWVMDMIRNPNHEAFYAHLGDQQKMPAFGERLNEEAIGHIADWLRGEWDKKPSPPTAPAAEMSADAAPAAAN